MRWLRFAVAFFCVAACPVFAQDPVKVSPKDYTVEIENDRVRVLRAKRAPHVKTPLHEHPSYMVVYLTDAHQRITTPDGKVQEVTRKAGESSFSKPVKHEEENLSDQPLEAIVIELKPKPAGAPAAPVTLDPVRLEPKYHSVDFENDQVRALRTILPSHIPSPMHEHPAYVVVYLTDVHTKMTYADGSVRDNIRKRGEVAWRDYMKHATENVEDRPGEEIQFELK